MLGDFLPITERGTTQRIDADLHPLRANRVHFDHSGQIIDIRTYQVLFMRGCRVQRGTIRNPLYLSVAVSQKRIRALLDPIRNIRVGGATLWWIVFKSAIVRRIVRW